MKTKITTMIVLTIIALGLLLGLTIGRKDKSTNDMKKTIETSDSTKVAERVLNLIILDESGSMSGLEKVSVDGVNETIQTIKSSFEKSPEQKQLLTFVTFSNRGDSDYRTQCNLLPISKVEEFNYANYFPNGGTPLYDTMGKALTDLEKEATDSDIVLVTIITDGYENSSREYNQESIKALITRLDEKNWVFTYIGANQDAVLEAGRIGIHNAMNYDADERGVREMWKKENSSRLRFMEGARTGTAKERLKRGYFENEK